jgi:hypothetical protein
MLVKAGHTAAHDDHDRAVFNQWLGMVAGLLVLRERAR